MANTESVDLPFWATTKAAYGNAWYAVEGNWRYIIYAIVLIFILSLSSQFLFMGFVPNIAINKYEPPLDFISKRILLILASVVSTLIIQYIGTVIQNLSIQKILFHTSPKSFASAFLSKSVVKIFSWQVGILLLGYFIVLFASLTVFFIAKIEFLRSPVLITAYVLFILCLGIYGQNLALRLTPMSAYIVAGFPIFKSIRVILNRTRWRYWKFVGLYLVSFLPAIIIFILFGASSFLFMGVLYQPNPSDAPDIPNMNLIVFSFFSALSYGLFIVLSSIMISGLSAEIFLEMEPDF